MAGQGFQSQRWIALFGSFLIGAANYKNLPVLFAQLQASLGLDATSLGLIMGLQGACHVTGVCCFGYATARISSRLGLLAACVVCWAIGTCLTSISACLQLLLLSRALIGVCSGVIGPVSQVLIAEWVKPTMRGKAFGWAVALDFAGQTLAAAGLAELIVITDSWRVPLLLLSGVTLVFAIFCCATAASETVPEIRHAATIGYCKQVSLVLNNSSVQVVILQGFLASTQKEANSFVCLWLQQCGFDTTQAAGLYALMNVGNLIGSIFAGSVSDRVAKRFTCYGRIVWGQSCDCLRIPALCCLLHVGPSQKVFPVACCCLMYGFTQSLCYVGTIKPLCTEVVPPVLVGTTIAIAATVDGAFSSLAGGPLVGWSSQHLLGYRAGDFSEENRAALQTALGSVLAISAAGTICCFSRLYWTIEADRLKASEEAQLKSLETEAPEEAPVTYPDDSLDTPARLGPDSLKNDLENDLNTPHAKEGLKNRNLDPEEIITPPKHKECRGGSSWVLSRNSSFAGELSVSLLSDFHTESLDSLDDRRSASKVGLRQQRARRILRPHASDPTSDFMLPTWSRDVTRGLESQLFSEIP
eukprot:TRINITY_DN18659_c2_g1_i1.p1 TRINITY_DN18659_c2_g1~~TRINITY_DN18659_c2_g1_i1.p1  ORF type:complete len:585 (+),score=81.04 TRINITY_DN18659_c2_g1_i1:181-1935(+)